MFCFSPKDHEIFCRVPDKSARMLSQLGRYEKTSRIINNYCLIYFFFNKIDGNHKATVICQKYWEIYIEIVNIEHKTSTVKLEN